MTKNKIAVILCLIALVIGVIIGIYMPSRANISAKQNNYTSLELSGDKLETAVINGKNCIALNFTGEYVGVLKFTGELNNIGGTAEIYLADSKEGLNSVKAQTVGISKKSDDAYITINNNVKYVAIDFLGELPPVISATFNPTNFVFSFESIFIWGFGLMLTIGIIVFFTLLRSSYTASTQIFLKYRHLVMNLISRDLKVKYRRSMLGFLWSILNPLLMALVINAVFQNLFRFDIEYFIVYYLTGSLIFNFMTEATTGSLTSVIGASSLIKKVYIPKYIFPLEKCLFAFVNMLFSSFAVIIVILIKRMPVHFTALLFFYPMICVLIFSLGLSLILASMNVFFRDIGHLYTVWTVAWMYLTPIIYPASILPNSIRMIMQLNPMYYYVTYFRDVVMYGNVPSLATHLICIIYAFLFLAVGLIVFKRKQDKFILYI